MHERDKKTETPLMDAQEQVVGSRKVPQEAENA
jgi:hypothetical protein